MIVDLFAGPGGWDEGLKLLGRDDVLGLEWEGNAADTRFAAGHKTWHTDIGAVTDDQIRVLAAELGPIEGLIASPPCQGFSMAGSKKGLDDIADLRRAIAACKDGWVEPGGEWADQRSKLVLEPLRWAWLLQPEWIACEQVPGVLPLWKAMAAVLNRWGYLTFVKVLNAADYGTVSPCPLHGTDWPPTDDVRFAERLSRSETALACVGALATTRGGEEPLSDALTVVASSAKAIAQAYVGAATPSERLEGLVRLAREETPTPRGRAGGEWTNAGMSECGWTAGTAESIGWWLSDSWDALSQVGKLSTTSTEIPATTIRRTLRCIAATLITGSRTGPAMREAGCGLCVDVAVPQTRERAILMAKRGPKDWLGPEPTHSKRGTGGRAKWVTMAQALGWGLNARPSTTVMSRHHAGPADPLDGGSGSRQVYADAREAGEWEPDPGSRVGFPRLNDRDDGGEYRERDLRGIDEPAFALTEKARSWQVYPPDDGPVDAEDVVLNTGRDWKPGGTRDDAQTIDPSSQPAPAFTAKAGGQWQLRSTRQPNSAVRTGDQPAPTMAFGKAYKDMVIQPAGEEHPANRMSPSGEEYRPTIDARDATETPEGGEWADGRPATTLACDSRVFAPGGHAANDGRAPAPGRSEGAMRIQPWQALVLQSFRPDYPVQGTWSRQFEQIGNAVLPLLAKAVLEPLLGLQVFEERPFRPMAPPPDPDAPPPEQHSLF